MLAIAATVALAFAVSAAADRGHDGKGEHRGNALFASKLVGSKPAPTDPAIHGVAPGGVPWDGGGSVSIRRDGRIDVRIRGLVITGVGNAGPVKTVTASLYCAGSDTAAATTGRSRCPRTATRGSTRSSRCPRRASLPSVLVHPNGNGAAYIAAPGWRG